MLAREALPPHELGTRDVDGALPLDEPEDLRHGVLRRDRVRENCRPDLQLAVRQIAGVSLTT